MRLLWLLVLLLSVVRAHAAELTLTCFSVGQGDALLIQSPTGKKVLIDGGPPESREALVNKLRARGVASLDLVLLTHPHLDHLGGFLAVLGAFPVRSYLDSGYPQSSPAYGNLLRALEERKIPVLRASAGRKIDLGGGATLTLLGPPSPFINSGRSDVNANSVVTRLTYGSAAAVLSGDAEPETEAWLLSQGVTLQAEVLKVGHHGSRYASGAAFLKAVQPRYALISVGARNDYGHPTAEALARLSAAGAQVLRTDQQGDITLRSRDGQPFQLDGAGAQTPPVAQLPPGQRPPVPRAPIPTASPPAGTSAADERVASGRSDVFHLPTCGAVSRIKAENLLRFPSRAAALQSGRRPAVDCQP